MWRKDGEEREVFGRSGLDGVRQRGRRDEQAHFELSVHKGPRLLVGWKCRRPNITLTTQHLELARLLAILLGSVIRYPYQI